MINIIRIEVPDPYPHLNGEQIRHASGLSVSHRYIYGTTMDPLYFHFIIAFPVEFPSFYCFSVALPLMFFFKSPHPKEKAEIQTTDLPV